MSKPRGWCVGLPYRSRRRWHSRFAASRRALLSALVSCWLSSSSSDSL